MMNETLIVLSLCFCWITFNVQLPRTEIRNNPLLVANDYYACPGPFKSQLTSAPEGYVPFYINHYGRHGSRHLTDPNDYNGPLHVLQQADSLGKLTPTGREVLHKVTLVCNESRDKLGELILRGAEQHQ